MSTVSVKESLTYGGKLFALWLAVTVVGGALTALGGYLAVPEIGGLIESGTDGAETASLAGGVVLSILGVASLITGNFALLYKLFADSVSRGTGTLDTGAPAPEPAASEETAREEKSEPAPEPPAEERVTEPGQAAPVSATEQPTAETVRQPADGQPAAGQSETGPVEESVKTPPSTEAGREATEPPEGTDSPGNASQADAGHTYEDGQPRERTAEEIAFGAGGESPERDAEESATVEDGEWFEEESTAERDDTETDEAESTEPVDRSEMETANDSSADPLSDQFDE